MWYEILPSFGIIVVALVLPHGVAMVSNKLLLGNAYRRRLDSQEQIRTYMRDIHLTGNPYKVNGLEAIPD